MRRALGLALAALMILPLGASADKPQIVCTRVDVPADHILAGSEALRAEPDDEQCDVILYLPLVVSDSLLLGALSDATEEAAERDRQRAEADRLATATCDELRLSDDFSDDDDPFLVSASLEEWVRRCASCEDLQFWIDEEIYPGVIAARDADRPDCGPETPASTRMPGPTEDSTVGTPDFVGLSLEEVEAVAEEHGLIVRVNAIETDSVDPWTVVLQDPSPGEPVIAGSTVELMVAVPVPQD